MSTYSLHNGLRTMEWVLKGVPDLLRLVYSATVVSFWRTVRKQNVWLKPATMMRCYTFGSPHAHNPDAVVRGFYAALKSWRKRRKTDPHAIREIVRGHGGTEQYKPLMGRP
ncbi:hypothetical protein [Sulfobacillus sp. hq2]|uniref:hypothetical protein n=1 Tax=Sulfobacillus TaxID=28033 RepID=UPI0011AEEFC8|nr:hypothetical protein [Sulfobacillus sp. hq2]